MKTRVAIACVLLPAGPPVDAGPKDQSTSDVVGQDAGVDAAGDVAPPPMTLAPPIFEPPGPTR